MPLYAAIDIGTNSVKFHLAERQADGTWRTVVDRSVVTRLGEGLRNDATLQQASMDRSLQAVADMAAEARQRGAQGIAAVGTMGLRTARNRACFLAAVRERCGIEVEVITGEEEARLGYLAARAGLALPGERLAVFDTGGGSTQFTFGSPTAIQAQFSLSVGAVRLTEQFELDRPVTAERLREAHDAIAAEFLCLESRATPEILVGMGGTVTNLAAVQLRLAPYDPDAVQGIAIEAAEVDRQIDLYRCRDVASRRLIVGLDPRRADVILAGACVVRTILRGLRQARLCVSDRGLRHGLLVERFSRPAENLEKRVPP